MSGNDEIIGNGGDTSSEETPAIVSTVPSNTGLSNIITVSTVQVIILPAVGQKDITITNLANNRVHYSFSTGVTTSHAFLNRNDQLVLSGYSDSVFILRNTGSGDVQIDQASKV